MQVANLQSRILEEDKSLEKLITENLAEWNKSKPIRGTQRPKDAIGALNIFDDKFKKLKDDLENIVKAKAALEISDSSMPGGDHTTNRLSNAFEELHDLLGMSAVIRQYVMSD